MYQRLRPGWFWHACEDDQVKSLEELIHVYENSVGGNATFLLNIPPTTEGLFHERDVKRLKELGDYIRETYRKNLADEAQISTEEDAVTLRWDSPKMFSRVVLMEDIRRSQRVEEFAVYDGQGRELYHGTVIGYKKIIPLEKCCTDGMVIKILSSRMESHVSFVGVY